MNKIKLMLVKSGLRTILLSAPLALILTGCSTPTQQISTFGAACGSIGSDAQKAYQLLDQNYQKKAVYETASDPTIIVDGNSTIFNSIMDENGRLEARTKMLSELTDYAQALQQLATKDFQTGIDSSSKNLAGALKSLKNDYEKVPGKSSSLTDGDIYILSTAVDAVGSAYVEWKRREYIKSIVIKADPAVQETTSLLTKEFGEIGFNVATKLNIIETTYEKAYKKEASNPNSTFETRVLMLENIQAAHANYLAAANFYATLVKASSKIGETHATLKDSLMENNWTSQALFAKVQELAAFAKQEKSFYQSLKQ